MSKDNLFFAATLALSVAGLASFMVYFGTADLDAPCQTGRMKNEYLVGTQPAEALTTTTATRPVATSLPAIPVAAEPKSSPTRHSYGGSGGSGGGHGGGGHR